MATAARITANQVNAQRSTGPRTTAGIDNCKYNATRHGLTSRRTVLPGEDPREFAALVARLTAENQPENELELEFVNSIASALWRLDRARGHESRLVGIAFGPDSTAEGQVEFDRILRYTASIERELHRSTIRLTQLQEQRRKRLRYNAPSRVGGRPPAFVGSVSSHGQTLADAPPVCDSQPATMVFEGRIATRSLEF